MGNLTLGSKPPKYWCFEDAEPNPQADADEYDAQREWDAPAPHQKRIARHPAKEEHCKIGQKQAGGGTELRPGRKEAALVVMARPFHRQQNRATPLAADADPLQEAEDGQQDANNLGR